MFLWIAKSRGESFQFGPYGLELLSCVVSIGKDLSSVRIPNYKWFHWFHDEVYEAFDQLHFPRQATSECEKFKVRQRVIFLKLNKEKRQKLKKAPLFRENRRKINRQEMKRNKANTLHFLNIFFMFVHVLFSTKVWCFGPWEASYNVVGACQPDHWACWAFQKAFHTWPHASQEIFPISAM